MDYVYGEMKLASETSKHCNFAIIGEKINGYYRFPKGFYHPADIPTIFQEKINHTLGHETPVWLDDIIVVTRGAKEEHTKTLESVLTKLEKRRLQGEQETVKILPEGDSLAGTYHCRGRNKAEQRKDGSHKQIKPTNKHKNTQILLGGDPMFCKIHTKSIREN